MSAIRTGLDYTALPGVAGMCGVTMTPSLFRDIQVMEHAALEAMAEGIKS